MTAASLGEIVALYERWGDDAYDEAISQLAHACQTAALAEADGASDALIVAALLHDVGHLLDLAAGAPGPDELAADLEHEATGARALAAVFPPSVSRPVALHVEAKRFLCGTDPAYGATLSAGSVASLRVQGGPMSATEADRFAARPGADEAIRLRRWDDAGKVVGLDVRDLGSYVPVLRRLAGSRLMSDEVVSV